MRVNKNFLKLFLLVALIVSIAVVYFTFFSKPNYDDFAVCLYDKAVLYGSYSCPACQKQKALFGSSARYLNYVDCPSNPQLCLELGVEYYPTWIIRNVSYVGVQPLEKLGALTGC